MEKSTLTKMQGSLKKYLRHILPENFQKLPTSGCLSSSNFRGFRKNNRSDKDLYVKWRAEILYPLESKLGSFKAPCKPQVFIISVWFWCTEFT